MLKGLYTAYTGMLNEQNRMDVLSNNLANTSTVGFKKEGTTSQGFDNVLAYRIKDLDGTGRWNDVNIGIGTPGVKIGENYVDYSQGAFRETGNTFDVALSGKGFFNIEFTNKAGETSTLYTRDGNFSLTKEGYLVTKDGDFVLGTNAGGATAHIQLNPNLPASIDQAGRIMQNNQVVANIKITDFADYNYLERYGENLFAPVEGASDIAPDVKVVSGYLEQSNVQTVEEMVNLISITRQYEANQKLIQTFDGSLDIAVNRIGKVQ
ncbi:MAG: flagellar hook-basal body protein [Lachnospiraceae bacterium]|nr:flagellar hook-basal body protein [Lachnospiraceae bacterium]